jgi:hypothetical protein
MEAFLAAVEATAPAQYLRASRWGYAAVSGAHVLGIALLVGAVVPLNLRLLGFCASEPIARAGSCRGLGPRPRRAHRTSALLRACAGNAAVGFLQAKLVLVLLGLLSALAIHHAYGLTLEGASERRVKLHALVSLGCWLGALACGRLIAFAID